MCCGRRLEARGYSSVCPGCCTLSHPRPHGKPEKGKWLKKMLRKWSQSRGGRRKQPGLQNKAGGDKGEPAREQRKLRRKEDSRCEGSWSRHGLTLELKNVLHGKRLNQQNPKMRGMP